MKILYFDGTGLWLMSKRLEAGTFSWPKAEGTAKLRMKAEALAMLTDGIDLRGAKMRPWYERERGVGKQAALLMFRHGSCCANDRWQRSP